MTDYTKLAAEIGALVTSKQDQYGDSVSKSGKILEILYPEGVQPHQYTDALLVVRILDKLSRIAQRGPDGQDKGGESPYRDIAGYGLLGASKDGKPEKVCAGLLHGFVWHEKNDLWSLLDSRRLTSKVVAQVERIGGANGWEYRCYLPDQGPQTAHGYADTAASARYRAEQMVRWDDWASKDGAVVVEAAKESYPVETLANKSPKWDEEYAGFRRQGYGEAQAARLADDVCQSSTE